MVARRFTHLFALAALSGCGGGSKPASINQVSGIVYFQGSPLTGGLIVFVPDAENGSSGTLVATKVDSKGQFKIVSTAEEPLRPGRHLVSVCGVAREEPPGQSLSLFRDVPKRYRNPKLSKLSCDLMAGANRVEIHLEDY